MPYKIHLENREPPRGLEIAGKVVETQIVPETPPLCIVETNEEAKEVMRELIAQGIRRSELYAVGHD
jgi:hypothetical protein